MLLLLYLRIPSARGEREVVLQLALKYYERGHFSAADLDVHINTLPSRRIMARSKSKKKDLVFLTASGQEGPSDKFNRNIAYYDAESLSDILV